MRNQKRILLVEDEIISAVLMETQLKNIGYTLVNHVSTGENAILSAKQNPPHLILMDIRLAGGIDGIEAVTRIQSESDIPAIFITGYEDPLIRERAEKLKPLAYLIKPLKFNNLQIIIDAFFLTNID